MAIRIVNPPEASAKPAPKPAAKCGCIFKLIEAQQSLRLQHWLTTSHAEHKTLGKAYEGLDDLIDSFVEAALGAKGREILPTSTTLTVGGDAAKILSTLEGVLRNEIPADIGDNETSLMNIRDEMLALVQKTRYLLTQK